MTLNKYAQARMHRAKARAKLAELSATSYSTTAPDVDIDKLHYGCIAAISQYADAVIQGTNRSPQLEALKRAAEFYDAASTYEEYSNHNDGFWIFALSAYFLMGHYGSAQVCLNKIKEPDYFGEEAAHLYQYLSTILSPENIATSTATKSNIQQNTPEDELFDRIRNAAQIQVKELSSVNQLSHYTDLSKAQWIEQLTTGHISQLLWPAQEAIMKEGILSGSNGFIQMPTGAGKTKSIELVLRTRILAGQCRKAIYVAPVTALCDEISENLTKYLSDIATVSRISDVRVPTSTTHAHSHHARIMVVTPEKLAYILRHDSDPISNVDLIVFDEAHLLGDLSRGPNFETLVTELLALLPPEQTQWIFISAVVSNARDIAEWALSDPSRVIYRKTPDTIRSFGMVSATEGTITYHSDSSYRHADYRLQTTTDFHPLKQTYNGIERRYPDVLPDSKYIAHDTGLYYANILAHRGGVAVFFPMPNSIRKAFKRFIYLMDSKISFATVKENRDLYECNKIAHLAAKHYGPNSEFIEGIKAGILPHYGNLPSTIRHSVEYALRNKFASTVFCTSTLSQGVNLPLKYVIVSSLELDRKTIEARDFHNLLGRAGRLGYYTEGSSLILQTPKNLTSLSYIASHPDRSLRCDSALLQILFREDVDFIPASRHSIAISAADVILTHYTSGNIRQKLLEHYRDTLRISEAIANKLTKSKINAISAIESYCSSFIHGPFQNRDVEYICRSTYAYHLASDFERQALLSIFSRITEGLRTLDPSVSNYFYKTQLDSTVSMKILDWIDSSEFVQFIESDCTKLDLLVAAYSELKPGIFGSYNLEEVEIALSHWTNGNSIIQILDDINNHRKQDASRAALKKKKKPTIDSIERLTMKTFAYHLEYFVSCIADAFPPRLSSYSQDYTSSLHTCQHRIKYGVSTLTEAYFCEQVVNDRMIAKDLRNLLFSYSYVDSGHLRISFESAKSEILAYSSSLPPYCERKIRSWLEDSSPIF